MAKKKVRKIFALIDIRYVKTTMPLRQRSGVVNPINCLPICGYDGTQIIRVGMLDRVSTRQNHRSVRFFDDVKQMPIRDTIEIYQRRIVVYSINPNRITRYAIKVVAC